MVLKTMPDDSDVNAPKSGTDSVCSIGGHCVDNPTTPRKSKWKDAKAKDYIGVFGLSLCVLVPIVFFLDGPLSKLMPHEKQSIDLVVWPIRNQYRSMIDAGQGANLNFYDFLLADFFVLTSLAWATIDIVFSLAALKQRDRYIQTLGSRGMRYWKFAGATFAVGALGIFTSIMKGSYSSYSAVIPSFVFSPKIFLLMATFMFVGGVLFLSEGLIFCVWWAVRGRRASE